MKNYDDQHSTQVGGHFPIVCLDGTTVCKPLNDREHREPSDNALEHFEFLFTGSFHYTYNLPPLIIPY